MPAQARRRQGCPRHGLRRWTFRSSRAPPRAGAATRLIAADAGVPTAGELPVICRPRIALDRHHGVPSRFALRHGRAGAAGPSGRPSPPVPTRWATTTRRPRTRDAYSARSSPSTRPAAPSRRTLALPGRCIDPLRTVAERRASECAAAGSRWRDSGLVFTTKLGTALDAADVRRDFRTAVRGAEGINPKDWTPRELRHSFVSLLSDNGCPLTRSRVWLATAAPPLPNWSTASRSDPWCRAEPSLWTGSSM